MAQTETQPVAEETATTTGDATENNETSATATAATAAAAGTATEATATDAETTNTDETEEIGYHAVEKDGHVTAIWEMQGRKHLRTIDPRSREGKNILNLFTSEHHDE